MRISGLETGLTRIAANAASAAANRKPQEPAGFVLLEQGLFSNPEHG
jgi:hypothetical protein